MAVRLSLFLRETATQTDAPGSDSTRLHMSLDITHTHTQTHTYTHWLPGGLGGVPTSCWEPTHRHTALTVSRSLCFLWKCIYPCALTKIAFTILVDRLLKLTGHGLGWEKQVCAELACGLVPNADHMTNWMPQKPTVNQTAVCMFVCLMERGYVCASGW